MIKKYNYKIAGIASFAGIAINNVKAVTTGDVTIKIGEKIYTKTGSKIGNNAVNTPENVLKEIAKLGSDLKDSDGKAIDLNAAEEKYFITSISDSSLDSVKFDTTNCSCNITTTNPITIELVKKSDVINIDYDTTCKKKLTKAAEEELLKSILQGKQVDSIASGSVTKSFKFDTQESSSTKVIDKAEEGGLILPKDGSKVNLIIKTIENGKFKTVVCNFADNTESKLVTGVDLENLCTAFKGNGKGLKQKGRKLTLMLEGLNECNVDGSNPKFFDNLDGVSIKKDGSDAADDKITGDTEKNFSGATFVVVDGIKEENINPIFLKKTFEVELDSNEINKTIVDDVKKLVEDKLKGKFEDTVVLNVSGIVDFLKTVQKSVPNDIFVATAFNNLGNVAGIEGVELKNNKFDGASKVNASAIKIKLKSAAFVATYIKTTINLTLTDIGNQTRGDKTLKSNVKTAIEKIFNDTKTAISKAAFVGKFNDSNSGIQLADANKKFAETDFEFSPNPTGDIDKDTNVTLKKEFWDKLNDSCFEEPKKPKEKEDDQSTSTSTGTGSGDNNGGKDSKKGCCGSNKK